MNILLIEDNEIDRMAFFRMMEKEDLDCNLEVAENISKAKNLLSRFEYQLVVCDLNLPDGTAFDLSTSFAKNTFVLLSGFVDLELKDKAKRAGISKVISKTSDLTQFSNIIEIIKQKTGDKTNIYYQPNQQTNNDEYAPILSQLKLTFDNNPAYIAEIIQTYLIENPKLLSRLSLAAEIEDKQQIVKTAHKLKSGYMMMGLKELENLATEIEINLPAKNEDLDHQIQDILERSHKSYLSLKAALLELEKPNNTGVHK